MPQWIATLIVGAVSLGGNLLATAYFYGRLTMRVDNHEKKLSEFSMYRKFKNSFLQGWTRSRKL